MSHNTSHGADPIVSQHRRHIEAVKTGDLAVVASLFSEDAVLMPPNDTSLYGRTEIAEWHREYFEHFEVAALGETDRDVTVLDGWAVERWSYMISISPVKGGEPIRDDGRWFALWRREPDGVWRMSQAMFNSIEAIGSGTSRYMVRMIEKRMEEKEKRRGDAP